MNKIVFLDFDGVLNHIGGPTRNGIYGIDTDHVNELNRIVEQTDCKIVITATLRKRYTMHALSEMLAAEGFKFTQNIIGKTSVMSTRSVFRGNDKKRKDLKYVILDDDSDMLLWQKDNLVKTKCSEGLTRLYADRVIELLNNGTSNVRQVTAI